MGWLNEELAVANEVSEEVAKARDADCDDILGHKQTEVVKKDSRILSLESEVKGLREDLEGKGGTILRMEPEKQRTN